MLHARQLLLLTTNVAATMNSDSIAPSCDNYY